MLQRCPMCCPSGVEACNCSVAPRTLCTFDVYMCVPTFVQVCPGNKCLSNCQTRICSLLGHNRKPVPCLIAHSFNILRADRDTQHEFLNVPQICLGIASEQFSLEQHTLLFLLMDSMIHSYKLSVSTTGQGAAPIPVSHDECGTRIQQHERVCALRQCSKVTSSSIDASKSDDADHLLVIFGSGWKVLLSLLIDRLDSATASGPIRWVKE